MHIDHPPALSNICNPCIIISLSLHLIHSLEFVLFNGAFGLNC
nr:MAG TPA: hypothetical protein [Caudoviricetes sp.]